MPDHSLATTLTDRRLVVVNQHPNQRLSPNAPTPVSIEGKRARQRIVKEAREAGYAAALATLSESPVGDLSWMTGPVDVDILIGWGVGSARKDDDNAIGMCKAMRDGIADLFGSSDRRWRTRRVLQTRSAATHPHGQVSFTFTPREESDDA